MPERHMMVDLETLALRDDARVVSIAATLFEPEADQAPYLSDLPCLHIDVDWRAQFDRRLCPETLHWWLCQPTEVVRQLTDTLHQGDVRQRLVDALCLLNGFHAEHQPVRVWAKGSLDFRVLEHGFRSLGVPCGWRYRGQRDVRTIQDQVDCLFTHDHCPGLVRHAPLDDCMVQATNVWAAFQARSGHRVLFPNPYELRLSSHGVMPLPSGPSSRQGAL